jgi:hypothetical protein
VTSIVTSVAHLIRKDLRAVAFLSLIWIFLMALEVALQLTGAASQPYVQPPPPLEILQQMLPFAEVVIAALIVSLVIHEDPLVDARAFWLTRPIPRGQLFLAKLTTIAMVIVTPALVALAVLLAWYHVPPLYMVRAGFEVVLWLAFPLLLLAAAAAFTSTVSRYLALLVGVLFTTLAVVGWMETFQPPQVRVFEAPLPRVADPALPVTVIIILIAGFCAAIHQFYRRRDWRIALGCIVLVAGTATLVARNWPGFTFFEPPGTATGAWTASARLRLLDGRKMMVSAFNARELRSVSAPLVLDGLPNGWSATPFTLNGQLTRADGTVLRTGRAMPMQVDARSEYQPSLTLAYGNDPIDAGPTSWEAWPVLIELQSGHRRPPNAAPFGFSASGPGTGAAEGGPADYTGAYKGTFVYRIARYEQIASLRLIRREGHTDGPRGITIVDAQDIFDARNIVAGCRVTLEVTNTELTLAGPREPAAGYYFIDRLTGARLRAARSSMRSGMLGPLRVGLSPGRRIFTAARVELDVKNPRDGGKNDAPACADTELIFVRTIPVGSLTRSFELPDFRAQPSQDSFFRR